MWLIWDENEEEFYLDDVATEDELKVAKANATLTGGKWWVRPMSKVVGLMEYASPEVQTRIDDLFPASPIHVPFTMDRTFEVPGFPDLKWWQREDVSATLHYRRCILGDPYGSGKTCSVMAALHYAHAFPALAVSPNSLIETTWEDEFNQWLAPLGYKMHRVESGSKIPPNFDFYIVSYELLGYGLAGGGAYLGGVPLRLMKLPLQAIVADEAQFIKNNEAKRTMALSQLVGVHTNALFIAVSGTPITGRPVEFVPVLKMMRVMEEFGGENKFKECYCNLHLEGTPTKSGWRTVWNDKGHSNEVALNAKLKQLGYIRHRPKDIQENFSEVERHLIPITLTAAEAQELQALESDSADYYAGVGEYKKKGKKLEKLGDLLAVVEELKVPYIAKWIMDRTTTGEKVLDFQHHQDEGQNAMRALFPAASHHLGTDDSDDRKDNIKRFVFDPECLLMIASLGTAGFGLNLAGGGCRTVCFGAFGWTPAGIRNAESRVAGALRSKGEKVTAYYFYIPGSIDEHVMKVINEKAKVVDAILEGTYTEEQEDLLSIDTTEEAVKGSAIKYLQLKGQKLHPKKKYPKKYHDWVE